MSSTFEGMEVTRRATGMLVDTYGMEHWLEGRNFAPVIDAGEILFSPVAGVVVLHGMAPDGGRSFKQYDGTEYAQVGVLPIPTPGIN